MNQLAAFFEREGVNTFASYLALNEACGCSYSSFKVKGYIITGL